MVDVQFSTKAKGEVAEALKHLVEEVADPDGLCLGRIRFDRRRNPRSIC